MPDNDGGQYGMVEDAEQAKPMDVLGNFSLNYLQQTRCYQAEELHVVYKHNLDICLDIRSLKHSLYWPQHFGNIFRKLHSPVWLEVLGFLFLFFLFLNSRNKSLRKRNRNATK